MQSVKWSMMNVHLFSCLLDLGLSFLTTPFVFFPLMAGYPLGFLEYLGVETEPQVYMIIFMGACKFVLNSVVLLEHGICRLGLVAGVRVPAHCDNLTFSTGLLMSPKFCSLH